MKIKNSVTETPNSLRLGLGMLVFSACSLSALPELWAFIDYAGLLVMSLLVSPAIWLRFRADIPLSRTISNTAIPAGIMVTAIGFHAVTTNADSFARLAGGASVMILPVVYGGSWAIIAYAFRDTNDYDIPQADRFTVLTCTLPVALSIFFAFSSLTGMTSTDYVSPKVLILFCGLIFLLLAGSASRNVARILAEASIIGIIICIAIALVAWFSGLTVGTIPKDATDFATLGLFYGTFLLMMSYYVSLLTGETDEINFDIKNWHLIELAALYILLVFAPPSIFEIAA